MKTEHIVSPLPPEQVLENIKQLNVPVTMESYISYQKGLLTFEDLIHTKVKANRFLLCFNQDRGRKIIATKIKGDVLPSTTGSTVTFRFGTTTLGKLIAIIIFFMLPIFSCVALYDHSSLGYFPLIGIVAIIFLEIISSKNEKNELRKKLEDICDVNSICD